MPVVPVPSSVLPVPSSVLPVPSSVLPVRRRCPCRSRRQASASGSGSDRASASGSGPRSRSGRASASAAASARSPGAPRTPPASAGGSAPPRPCGSPARRTPGSRRSPQAPRGSRRDTAAPATRAPPRPPSRPRRRTTGTTPGQAPACSRSAGSAARADRAGRCWDRWEESPSCSLAPLHGAKDRVVRRGSVPRGVRIVRRGRRGSPAACAAGPPSVWSSARSPADSSVAVAGGCASSAGEASSPGVSVAGVWASPAASAPVSRRGRLAVAGLARRVLAGCRRRGRLTVARPRPSRLSPVAAAAGVSPPRASPVAPLARGRLAAAALAGRGRDVRSGLAHGRAGGHVAALGGRRGLAFGPLAEVDATARPLELGLGARVVGIERTDLLRRLVGGRRLRLGHAGRGHHRHDRSGSAAGAWALASSRRADSVNGLPQLEQ